MDTGEPLSTVRDRSPAPTSTWAPFRSPRPWARARRSSSPDAAPTRVWCSDRLIHEFGWEADRLDKLAAGTVAGHIVECGAQCTGGNYTDWREVPNMARIGYPIIEARADGSFTVTKHDGTGGMVTKTP